MVRLAVIPVHFAVVFVALWLAHHAAIHSPDKVSSPVLLACVSLPPHAAGAAPMTSSPTQPITGVDYYWIVNSLRGILDI